MAGVAVNVILFPAHNEVEDALIETDGVTDAAMILIALLVAVITVVQPALEVMIALTWSPFKRLLEVNVGELVPAFTPFICH